jgi:hypothetical protein
VKSGKRLLAGFVAAALISGTAFAQTEGPGGRTVYEAAYFKTFSPSNALEMVQRVPGFALDTGNQEVRGFGGAAGNVVINGQRPSSKSDSLQTILSRIPASRVLRIEVGPGDLFGSEFSGKPQVLNIVLGSTGGLAGSLTANLRRDFTGRVAPEGSVSALLKRGRSSFNGSLGLNNVFQTEEGSDTLTSLSTGSLVEFRRKVNRIGDRQGSVSGSWEHQGGTNRSAHLNFRAAKGRFTLDQDNDVFPVGGTNRDDFLTQASKGLDLELGGDVTRPFLGGGLKLIGLATRRSRDNEDVSLNRVQSEVLGGFAQEVDNQRNENVLRLVWSRANLGGWSVEMGGEAVHNSLDSDVNLFLISGGGARERIDLPVDQAVVTEYRAEAFANVGRALSPALRMDLGLTFEGSRLTVRGDATAERALRFLKPKAAFDWRPPGGWHLQLSIARTVAQLNFEDFISTAELSNDRVNGGNAELLPQRAWEVQGTVEHAVLGDGLAKLEAAYHHISLLQDRIPTPEGFDAPGNIGTGRRAFTRATLDLPLTKVGIKGGRLNLRGTLQHTSVRDPYTNENRRFSGFGSWEAQASFRQDLGRFAWGVSYFGQQGITFFRRNEEDNFNTREPLLTAFLEYRPDPKTTFTLGADNIADIRTVRERTFFLPDRSNRSPAFFERRERHRHVEFSIGLKRSFG